MSGEIGTGYFMRLKIPLQGRELPEISTVCSSNVELHRVGLLSFLCTCPVFSNIQGLATVGMG